jgi:hypothetical protein
MAEHGACAADCFAKSSSMSIDTLRTSKMRSALTVLGVVIGITSIVGMTSLIRGFDESLRDSISELGPNTLIVQKFGALSFSAGKSFLEVAQRPNLTTRTRARSSAMPVGGVVDVWLGRRRTAVAHLLRHEKTTQIAISARPRTGRRSTSSSSRLGRCSRRGSRAPRQVVVLGQNAVAVALPEHRSDRQEGRIGANAVHRHRRARQAAEPGGFGGATTSS